ncbi:hypothetical protein SAMN05421858_2847 [Haladaptatus litoreus]|uniref:Uncharacterized protein n=1 Tax=Haladaptatus litoreus TaxID=553468 RepID=A0A1N7BYV1_9EURY|nr:hypothetical protein [Haladaptatus litoreus]SIR56485.1 hypothetical protein SAMN05421858_2847 [Haladaptatus litoreus]
MFNQRTLPEDVAAVRDEHAPDTLVLDCNRDFETLPVPARDDLALLTDEIRPFSASDEWLPDDAPELLRRFAGTDLVVGMPGDGSVAWTHQTSPPVVFVKARVEGSPAEFIDFLLAEALVEIGLDLPEQFLEFFGERYREFADVVPLDSGSTYQLAVALCDAYNGLHTREVFAEWRESYPRLFDAWQDAGERIEPRVEGITREVASGRTDFSDATELACSAIKHGIEPPAPFSALDTQAYRHHGVDYAIKWAEKTLNTE